MGFGRRGAVSPRHRPCPGGVALASVDRRRTGRNLLSDGNPRHVPRGAAARVEIMALGRRRMPGRGVRRINRLGCPASRGARGDVEGLDCRRRGATRQQKCRGLYATFIPRRRSRVARVGLEPTRLAAQASKTCVAASYTTGPAPASLYDSPERVVVRRRHASSGTWGGSPPPVF
jgi:hypothetical protein